MRQNKLPKLLLRRSVIALLALYGGASQLGLAQDSATVGAENGPPAATVPDQNTVHVTARRREETLQDVPIAVTAFTADQLAKTGAPDITALALALPNTTLKASRATNSTLTAFIRGVGQQDPVAGFEGGVGIYLDDIYLARPQAAVADIYDVERIEVLRGPQGTLYGRNTIGGAVKYVTRKLGPKPEVRAKLTLGNYNERDAVLTGSTPISDTMRIGATLAHFQHDGYGHNFATGRGNYDKDVSAARVSLEMTPTPDWFIRLAADLTQDNSDPKNGHRLTPGRTSGAPVLGDVYDTRAELTQAEGHDQEVRAHGVSALVQWNMNSELSFKSITAQRMDNSWAPIDFDALPVVDFEVPAQYRNRQFSQEFNVTYTGAQLQGVAGVYYIDATAFDKFDTILAGAIPTTTYTMDDIDTRAWAVYADGSMDLSPALSLSVGGRYTSDQRKAKILRQIYFGAAGSPGLGTPNAVLFRTDTNYTNGELDKTDTKFTPRVSLEWKATPDQNVYASYSQGFKGGGFDPRLNVVGTRIADAQARAGFAPETINSYELGLKSAFADKRFLSNLAVFYSDYKNVQIPGSVAIDTNGDGKDDSFAGITTNAGKAKIKGVELEASAKVTSAFTVSGMYSYIDAKYDQYIVNGVNMASQRNFQNTPRNSSHLRANYDLPVPMMGHDGTLSLLASAAYKGKTYQFETPSLLDQDPYYVYDASVVWTRKDGKIRAGIYGRNLSNTHYKTAGYLYPTLGFEGVVTAFYGPPRTVAASVEYRF